MTQVTSSRAAGRGALRRYLARPLPADGLAVIRIGASIVIALEVLQLRAFSDLILPWDQGLAAAGVGRGLLVAWLVVLAGLAFGVFTLPLAVLNFACTTLTFGVTHEFEYHADNIYCALALLFLVAPISERLSIDRLLRDLRRPAEAFSPTRGLVARAWYLAFAFIGLGLFYWDSAFHKLQQELWMNGLGMWLPSSLPQATWLPLETLARPVLEVQSIAVGIGYLTLLFETLFIWLMWWRWPRTILLIIGVGLHVGIWLAFPIPYFAAIEIALYSALLPVSFWGWLRRSVRVPAPVYVFLVPARDETALRWAVYIRALDVRSRLAIRVDGEAERPRLIGTVDAPRDGKRQTHDRSEERVFQDAMAVATQWLPSPVARVAGLLAACGVRGRFARAAPIASPVFLRGWLPPTVLIAWFFAAQSIMTFGLSGTGSKILTRLGLDAWNRPLAEVARDWRPTLRRLAGITPHALFLDGHFRGYDHDVRVRHLTPAGEETLPIIDDDGRAGTWNRGRNWANWSFRVMAAQVNMDNFQAGLERWLRYWADQRDIDLEAQRFALDVKKTSISWEWQEGTLARNVAVPWRRFAIVEFKNGRMTGAIPDIKHL